MGLSVAIAGGIVMVTIMLLFLSIPNLVNTIFSIGEVTSLNSKNDDSMSKTKISVSEVSTMVGSAQVNFTLSNEGSVTLWDYTNFNVLIEYTGAITGKITQPLSFSGQCPAALPPVGNWCIEYISNDIADPKLLNSGEKARIRTTLTENLAVSNIIIGVATDNGVTFKTGVLPKNDGIPKPTHEMPKKWSEYEPISTTLSQGAYGFLELQTVGGGGASAFTYNATGKTGQFTRTMVASAFNDNAGLVFNTTAGTFNIFRGDNDPYLFSRFYVSDIIGTRLFVGFHELQAMQPNNSNSILNGGAGASQGAGICVNSTSTFYWLCTNGAGGGNASWEPLGVVEDGAIHTFEVYAKLDGAIWCGRIDGGSEVCTSFDIPTATTRMYMSNTVESANNVAKSMGILQLYVESDR